MSALQFAVMGGTEGYGGQAGVEGEVGDAFGGAARPGASGGGALPGIAIFFGESELLFERGGLLGGDGGLFL